jgi:solute carrier family 25 (mitochondrial thiamine pyrophosphate transporter), member 19
MVGYNANSSSDLHSNHYIIASALSGFFSRSVVQPLDVVKVRFQLQVEPLRDSTVGGKYRGLLQAIRLILREEGLSAFWKGHVYAQCQAVSFVTLQFYSYEMLTSAVGHRGMKSSNSGSHFICGSLAGTTATIFTQPLDVLRARFIAQGEPRIYKGFFHAVERIATKEGIQGFYRGLLPSVLLTAPQSGIQFTFYNLVNFLLNSLSAKFQPDQLVSPETLMQPENIGFMQSFVAGGIAGACAKCSVYPLDMTKRRMQVQGFEEARIRFGRLHQSSGLFNCLTTIAKEEGVKALYKGISPSLLKSVLSIGSRFCAYEQICNFIRRYRKSSSV